MWIVSKNRLASIQLAMKLFGEKQSVDHDGICWTKPIILCGVKSNANVFGVEKFSFIESSFLKKKNYHYFKCQISENFSTHLSMRFCDINEICLTLKNNGKRFTQNMSANTENLY